MATGLVLVKKFTYRGDPTEEWSNKYWFTGSTPSDATAWRALFDALVAQEKTLYINGTTVIRGYGYSSDADDATAVWAVDMTIAPNTPVAGSLAPGTNRQLPGDAAVWVRWGTSRMNRGRRIYLRKYIHGALSDSAGAADVIAPVQKTALLAFGAKMRDGSFLDARTLTARGHTDTLVGHGCSDFVTTRTLKRRGKRSPT